MWFQVWWTTHFNVVYRHVHASCGPFFSSADSLSQALVFRQMELYGSLIEPPESLQPHDVRDTLSVDTTGYRRDHENHNSTTMLARACDTLLSDT